MALRFSAILRELITAGLAGEELISAVERIEGLSTTVRSSAAERQARYRARISSRDAVDVTNVTGDAVTSRDVTHNDPSSFFYKKESINEKRKEEKKEERIENTRARGDFDEFWDAFPNKVGKQAAKTSFEKVCKSNSVTFDVMMSALRRYVTKTDDRPWCNPTTWLNQGRWEDQPAGVKSGTLLRADTEPVWSKPPPGFKPIEEILRSGHDAANGTKIRGDTGLGENGRDQRPELPLSR